MAKMIIHINRHIIASNAKHGTKLAPISVKAGRANTYTNGVDIMDAQGNVVARVVYRPDKPLKCGATVWIEALHGVDVVGQGSWSGKHGGQCELDFTASTVDSAPASEDFWPYLSR